MNDNFLNAIKTYQCQYIDEIPFFKIDNYFFIYFKLKNNKEVLALFLNKRIISKNDINLINKSFKNILYVSLDNATFKDDLLYIDFINYTNIYNNLKKLSELLYELNYTCKNNCIMCGNTTSLHKFKDFLMPICSDNCIKNLIQYKKEEVHNKTYIKKSIINSIIFGFIGVIPSLIIALILQSYSMISTTLIFFISFLATLFFYKTPLNRTLKSSIISSSISFIYLLIYHIILIFINIKEHNITSFKMYFEVTNTYFYEALIGSILLYILGIISALFLSKKKYLKRFKKIEY